ncbi:guanosine pentaphosphatase [Psychromonas sp. KJ10-10]|uniref:Ppx/GppA phosphatase family protein n=1 Tax=Psychromonas sp. KJ10-10 TaxID=3391823 RepID=UPI0039B48D8B
MTDKRYTIIDLGSNSFHMLTVIKTEDGFSVFSKNKQKVRLASGLDQNNYLNQETINNGLHCLKSFREQLEQINPHKVLITATAALRLAVNNQQFIQQAENILKYPINLISGIEEAKIIYQGVTFTTKNKQQMLIIDIGGASTELIIGKGKDIIKAESLHMGCVTWLKDYFPEQKLSLENFNNAIKQAKDVIQPHIKSYKKASWKLCMGASGTIQAIKEVNNVQQLDKSLTLELLYKIKQQCIDSEQIQTLNIEGLEESRKPVFASGLAILIALFECLDIEHIAPSNGALREGLISMMFEGES